MSIWKLISSLTNWSGTAFISSLGYSSYTNYGDSGASSPDYASSYSGNGDSFKYTWSGELSTIVILTSLLLSLSDSSDDNWSGAV